MTEDRPLKVAIIGAGPAAFYAAEQLLKEPGFNVHVDMFDRLPTPYGLVRAGVAPDHQKIKTVTRSFAHTADDERFRFFGNVEFGRDITIDDVRAFYHQVLFATGAQTDKHMGIPGEELRNSHPATSFVAWYNGHPDFAKLTFDLSQERVAIVGVGNVAIDVARILSLSPRELAATDMADYAIEALSASRVREVFLLGRRGPAQAAFTNPEIKELGELEQAAVRISKDEAELDPISREVVANTSDRALIRKVEMLQAYAGLPETDKPRKLTLRFLVSPLELLDDGTGAVGAIRLGRNRLAPTPTGTIVPEPTGEEEVLEVGMVFRSVGYRGVALPGVPFHDRWGVILNERGRVLDPETDAPIPGEYVTGWIKRGPTGVIGTNKPDSAETVACMLADAAEGKTFPASRADEDMADVLLGEHHVRFDTFPDWLQLDALETERGIPVGRPRVKFTSVEDMLAALGK